MRQLNKSVHLRKALNVNNIPFDENTLLDMEFARKICSLASSIRKKNNIKARMPLQSLLIVGSKITLNIELQDVIKNEINIKEIKFSKSFEGMEVRTVVNLDAKKVAKRIGKSFQVVLQHAKQGIFTEIANGIEIAGHQFDKEEYTLNLQLLGQGESYASIDGKYLMILDTNPSKELQMEGLARDFIRSIQSARKEENLNISDTITLKVHFKENHTEDGISFQSAIKQNEQYIKSQVLAREIAMSPNPCNSVFNDAVTFAITL